jgi:glycosyltransferase involved in cell wall biosynthesis
MSVSAFLPVFNEEKRIEASLRTLQWCDEIVVLDKNSSDRTREIATEFNAKVVVMEEDTNCYSSHEIDYLLQHCTSEWVMVATASDVIDCALADELTRLTSEEDFPYDIIAAPMRRYILGIHSERSPWYSPYGALVYRKRVVKINPTAVHGALKLDSTRVHTIDYLEGANFYHLAHETVDMMMSRHMRYWRGEASVAGNKTLMRSLYPILVAFKHVLLARKTPLLGWDGWALSSGYVSYFMLSFLYKWERRFSRAPTTYREIRERILADWERHRPSHRRKASPDRGEIGSDQNPRDIGAKS